MSLRRPGNYNDILLGSCDPQNSQPLQEDFPSEIKKRVHRFVAGELLLVFKCVLDV